MDDIKIKERFALFIKPYQSFLAGNFVDEVTSALGQVEQLDEDQMEIFRNGVSLYLLCFLDADETIDFLSEEADLDLSLARPLFGAVMSAMPQEVLDARSAAFNAINTTDSELLPTLPQVPQPPIPIPDNPYPKQDAQGTNIYQTSQDAVLNQNPQTDAARWGQV